MQVRRYGELKIYDVTRSTPPPELQHRMRIQISQSQVYSTYNIAYKHSFLWCNSYRVLGQERRLDLKLSSRNILFFDNDHSHHILYAKCHLELTTQWTMHVYSLSRQAHNVQAYIPMFRPRRYVYTMS